MKPGRFYWKAEYDPIYNWWKVSAQTLTPGGGWLYVFYIFNARQKADLYFVADRMHEMQRLLIARANPYLENN